MQIVPLEPEHFLSIDWQESQAPWRGHLTEDVADFWGEHGEGLSLLSDEGEVIATAAILLTRVAVDAEGRYTPLHSHAVAVFSPVMPRYAKTVFSRIRAFLDDRPEEKITMHVWPADAKAARFAKRLGFAMERAAYDEAIGAFVHVYARLRD